VHTPSSGDLSVLHALQHQLIWVGSKPMDDPEQAITEAEVQLGLRTQPGQYLRDHEDISIPKIPFNEYLNINMGLQALLADNATCAIIRRSLLEPHYGCRWRITI